MGMLDLLESHFVPRINEIMRSVVPALSDSIKLCAGIKGEYPIIKLTLCENIVHPKPLLLSNPQQRALLQHEKRRA